MHPYPFKLLLKCQDAAFASDTGNLPASVSDFHRWTIVHDGPTSKAPPSHLRDRWQKFKGTYRIAGKILPVSTGKGGKSRQVG